MKKMNKTFKRIAIITSASLLAACAMVPATMNAFAAAGEITFKNGTVAETANTYTAYKIFSGVADGSGFEAQAKLENIQWAKSGAEALIDKLKADTRFGEGEANAFYACTTAASVADVLKGYGAKSAEAIAFAEVVVDNADLFDGKTSASGIISLGTGLDTEATADDSTDDGYYVIAQTTHVGVTTAYILGVYDASAGAEVNVKVGKPTFKKKIADINDSKDTTKGGWQDSADYDIGDSVPFQLTATLPSDYALYNEYMLVFHDKLDASLTYDAGSAKYYVNGTEWGTPTVSTETCENCNIEFKLDDLKQLSKDETKIDADDVITIEFTAKLNENAVIGKAGNWNEASLEYSNNPYFISGTAGDGIDNDGDGVVDEEGEEEETTDKTEVDKVVAFTYQTVINKVDENGVALKGAEFKLEKKLQDGTLKEIGVIKNTEGTVFTFKGLDDGDYVLTETAHPVGYNALAKPIEFTITAAHIEEADVPALTSLNTITAESVSTVIELGDYTANVEFEDGKIVADIENKSGATLPGTGGIGTTIFYLGGGVMAAIGGVYLISKRRMKKSEE